MVPDQESGGCSPAELQALAQLLTQFGCPPAKALEMASQLDRRARQLAAEKSRPYEDALRHLLNLMRQGWAAKERSIS